MVVTQSLAQLEKKARKEPVSCLQRAEAAVVAGTLAEARDAPPLELGVDTQGLVTRLVVLALILKDPDFCAS